MLAVFSLFGILLGTSIPGAVDASPPFSASADAPGTTLYLPFIANAPGAPSDLEVTQVVQQPGNPVLLIEGRATFVRYTLTDATAHTGVNAYLHGSRGGSPLPGSPISAMNNPRTLEASANRADWNDTFNFELPASWTSGTVELWGAASNGGSYDIVEGPVMVSFSPSNPLPLMVVPIAYTCTSGGTGTTTPSGSPYAYLDDVAYKYYPVPSTDLDMHAPVSYSGPCYNGQPYPSYNTTDGGDWYDMLYLITNLWNTEGRPNRYYYGLVQIYCGGSCIAGLGWVGGSKAAVGWNGGSQYSASGTHAHELGHNHGLPHAPGCGAGNPDPLYPYANGKIGDAANPNFGYDIITDAIRVYSSYYDFMTYCSSDWISDYNYEKLYQHHQAQGDISLDLIHPPDGTLLISGSLRPDGSVSIRPAFHLDVPAATPQMGDYTLELRDGAGAVLAEHPFGMTTIAVDGVGGAQGGESRAFSLSIPYTSGVESITVSRAGTKLGTRQASGVDPREAFGSASARFESGSVQAAWGARAGLTYLVRLSLDGGGTWQTVAAGLKHPALDLPMPAGTSPMDLRLEIYASDGVHTERLDFGPNDLTR
jgi:hypothetical protein